MTTGIDDVLGALGIHSPVDDRERESIARFGELVHTLERPFDEEAGPVHVTASAIVVSDAGDKVALHLHKRLGMWLQPGGHIEPGEHPAQAALREAAEETGVPVRHARDGGLFMHVDVHPGPKGHTHLDLRYLVRAPEVAPAPAEGESTEVAWFGWDEAQALADPGLAGALVAARALLE
ncbi:MAG: NUDIX hydrolase [Ilumatobacteraceae bacterium]